MLCFMLSLSWSICRFEQVPFLSPTLWCWWWLEFLFSSWKAPSVSFAAKAQLTYGEQYRYCRVRQPLKFWEGSVGYFWRWRCQTLTIYQAVCSTMQIFFLLSEELVVWFEGFIMCPEIDTTAVIAFLFLFSFFFLTQCPIFLWVKQKPQCHITSLSASPGVGIAMLMVTLIVSIYYNVIIAYSLYYMFASFQSPLPWSSCFSWADSNCSDTPTGASFHLQTCCLSADVLFSRGGVT